MIRTLPPYKGYTVDIRLQEFRKAVFGQELEFIPFDSQKDQKLLKGFIKTPEARKEYLLHLN